MAAACLAAAALPLSIGADALGEDARKMLVDTGGWEYVTLSDEQNGFPTVHTCFDGNQHENECSGRLILTPGKTFTQVVRIKGHPVRRHGTYELNGNQLAFFDELGTKDGPYTLSLDTVAKRLKMSMPQVNVELMLESEYREQQKAARHK